MTAGAFTPVPDPTRSGRGIARLHAITPPDVGGQVMPLAQPQAVLDLEIDHAPDLSTRPSLRVVTGDERELDAFSARFAQAVVEVIGGDRGVHQLMRWTTEWVYADLMATKSSSIELTALAIVSSWRRILPSPMRRILSMITGTFSGSQG